MQPVQRLIATLRELADILDDIADNGSPAEVRAVRETILRNGLVALLGAFNNAASHPIDASVNISGERTN